MSRLWRRSISRATTSMMPLLLIWVIIAQAACGSDPAAPVATTSLPDDPTAIGSPTATLESTRPVTTAPTLTKMPARTPTPPTTASTRRAATAQRPANLDEEVLIALYNATGGPNWKNSQNWLSDEPISNWHGVRFHEGKVAELWLPDNGLTGEIPPELGNFEGLVGLDLSGNQLTGDIPPELWNLTSLVKLDLSENRLTGGVPPELGNLRGMKKLLLAGNQLAGDLPKELGQLIRLEIVELAGNRLTGCIPARFHEVTVGWKGSEGRFDFGGLQPCAVAATPAPTPARQTTPTPATSPLATPTSTAGPTQGPTPTRTVAPTPAPTVAPTQVPATIQRKLASDLPWVLDGLTTNERKALDGLQHVESEHPSMAPAILGLKWVTDGVNEEEWGALSGLQLIPAKDASLLRILLASPWFVEGNSTERHRIGWGQILAINSKDPPLAQNVAGLPWVADGTTRWEGGQISRLRQFWDVDVPLTHRVASERWFIDGISWQERTVLVSLQMLANEDVDSANSFLDLVDPLMWEGPFGRIRFAGLLAVPALMTSGLWQEITVQPWYQDGLTVEEIILIYATYEVHNRNEQAALQIIHSVPTGDHIMVEDDFILPLGGKVKLYAVSRNPSLLAEVFERNRTAVVEIEKFLKVPFPKIYAGVFLEPTAPSNYRDIFVNVVNADQYNTYHEVVHTYFRNDWFPLWLSEGAAEFLTYHIIHKGDLERVRLYYLLNCSAIGDINVSNVRELIEYRLGGGRTDKQCEYTIGRKFLEGMYFHLGGDVLSSWLRALYRATEDEDRADTETGSRTRLTENEVYQILLTNTPPDKRGKFLELYGQLHGGPIPDS